MRWGEREVEGQANRVGSGVCLPLWQAAVCAVDGDATVVVGTAIGGIHCVIKNIASIDAREAKARI